MEQGRRPETAHAETLSAAECIYQPNTPVAVHLPSFRARPFFTALLQSCIFPFAGCYRCSPFVSKKKKKKPDGFSAVYPRKHFEHSVIKLGGNPSLPLCLLASNHINMKWGCFWVLTQCHRPKHSRKYFQDAALNQDSGWGKATSVLERNSFLLQPLSKWHWHLAINIQKLLYPQDHFSCQ